MPGSFTVPIQDLPWDFVDMPPEMCWTWSSMLCYLQAQKIIQRMEQPPLPKSAPGVIYHWNTFEAKTMAILSSLPSQDDHWQGFALHTVIGQNVIGYHSLAGKSRLESTAYFLCCSCCNPIQQDRFETFVHTFWALLPFA